MKLKIEDLLATNYKIKLTDANDAIKILETGLPGMIFTLSDIDENFFDLKNKILGETFQKFATYRYPIAIVFPDNHNFGDRVTELAREHSNHNSIRFCSSMEDARQWMISILGEEI